MFCLRGWQEDGLISPMYAVLLPRHGALGLPGLRTFVHHLSPAQWDLSLVPDRAETSPGPEALS